jgi:RNA polymerase sigma-70 factor (sigma-E family)
VADTDLEFRAFAEARSRALLRTAYLITGDHHHAEDLLQTTLTKVFLAWSRIRDKGSAEAYARRTLVTTYVSWRRRRWWQEHPTGEGLDQLQPDGAGAEHERLWGALHGLSRQQRAVVVLRFLEDQSVDEVARLLGITSGSVKTHTSRALAAMRIQLDQPDAAGMTEGGARR